ncbi:MAG: tRNA 2-thiocytidine(32) synthetase TtcA [Anaerolineae bacterium]
MIEVEVSEQERASRIAAFLLKRVNRAIRDFAMIRDGDRIAVAVSGGKDSLGLLHLLSQRRRSAPEKYELIGIHIRGDGRGPTEPYEPLETWLRQLDIPVVCEDWDLPPDEPLPMNCFRCSWNRRRQLFLTAHRLGCNVVALGHHADDIIETFLLNLFQNGRLDTMAPHSVYFDGVLRLIRPLIYAPEKEMRRLAAAMGFPPPPPSCPQSDSTAREDAHQLLQMAQARFPQTYANLLRLALSPYPRGEPVRQR